MRDKVLLRQLQALPLNAKILMSQQRIREWYNYFNGRVCISFSGGKDSTVLAHLVHSMYPDVPMVFANTGLEYPEIQAFARKMGAEFVRPKMRFDEVISAYGYPIISKEVAEAIHFARRIIAKNPECLDFVERERERVLSCGDGQNSTEHGTIRNGSGQGNKASATGTQRGSKTRKARNCRERERESTRTEYRSGDEPTSRTVYRTSGARKNRSELYGARQDERQTGTTYQFVGEGYTPTQNKRRCSGREAIRRQTQLLGQQDDMAPLHKFTTGGVCLNATFCRRT